MRLFAKYIFLWLSLLCLGNVSVAQNLNYPVSVTPFFSPNYSTQWSEFYGERLLKVSIIIKDNAQLAGNVKVFARFSLERVGITIQNPADFVPTHGTPLSFGNQVTLSGADLSESFLPQNLVVSGIDDAFLRQGGSLPDGLWTFRITLYEFDAARGYRQISNQGVCNMSVFLGQPPLLLFPARDSEIDSKYIPNVLFQWMPRATSAEGGMASIEYTFQLWQLGDEENENDVGTGKTIFYEETVNSPFLSYDASKTPMVAGKNYAWRVTVKDLGKNNAYENDGKSEVWKFRYGISCKAPTGLSITNVGNGMREIAWDLMPEAASYELRWRQEPKNEEQTKSTTLNYINMLLSSEDVYHFEVRTLCKNAENSPWSETVDYGKAPILTVNVKTATASAETPTDTDTNNDLEGVLNPLGKTVTSGDTNPDKANELLKKPEENITRCNNGIKTMKATCDDDKATPYTGGTAFPSPPIGTKLYINGYEIVLTSGNAQKGEGLLFFPYLMKRLPVEWNNIQIMKGEEPTYGCIVGASDIVQVQGSNSSILSDDLNRQFTALAASLNEPGSFTGTFGQAIEAAKTKAKELLDKIARGDNISPEDYKGYNNICKAIDKGMDNWLSDIDKVYGNPATNTEVAQIYNDLVQYRNDLKNEMNCDGTGYVPTQKSVNQSENPLFYASLNIDGLAQKKSDNSLFNLLSACRLAYTKPTVEKIVSKIADFEKINLIATKDPNGNYISVDYEYFISHNGQSRSYFNTLKLNGAPLGIKYKDVQYYWNGVDAYTNVTKWTNNIPEFGSEKAPVKVVSNPDIYYYYVYSPNGDCSFEKRTIDGKTLSSIQFSECKVKLSTDSPKKPDGKDIVCPTLPTELTADNLINKFFHNDYFAHCLSILTVEERKTLLNEILNHWTVTECLQNIDDPTHKIGNCYEPLCKNIILSTPPSQQKEILDYLKSQGLLDKIFDKLQLGTFDIVLKTLSDWIHKEYPKPSLSLSDYIYENGSKTGLIDRTKSKYIRFTENKVSASFANGKVTLHHDKECEPIDRFCYETVPATDFTIDDPYSYVLVYFEDDAGNFKKGNYYSIPAIEAHLIFNKDRRDAYITTGKIALEVGLLALGVGEFTTAYRTWQTGRGVYATYLATKATLDLGMGITDIYIQNELAEKWKREGQEAKLAKWNEINKWYIAGSFSVSVLDVAITKLGIGKTIDDETELNRLYDELAGVKGFVNRLESLNLTNLKREFQALDNASQTKFIDDFTVASDEGLRSINENTSLVNYWKINGSLIKNRIYPNVGHKAWDETKNIILTNADPTETKILNAVENANPPSNSQVALAGAYSPELGGNVILKYNDKNFDINSLESELKQHLEYLGMIKNDFDKGGELYKKLYSNVPLEKIQNAGEVGKHAEVIATNEVIKQLKEAGKFHSIQDLDKIHVLVKGRPSFGNMCRCPHCFQIIDGVKMIGNQ